jgi:hypothetical protein
LGIDVTRSEPLTALYCSELMTLPRRYTDDGLPSPGFIDTEVRDEGPTPSTQYCDSCGEVIRGRPAGSGLFLWTRGDEVRYEEPPLCESCAPAIAFGATVEDDVFEDE